MKKEQTGTEIYKKEYDYEKLKLYVNSQLKTITLYHSATIGDRFSLVATYYLNKNTSLCSHLTIKKEINGECIGFIDDGEIEIESFSVHKQWDGKIDTIEGRI